MLRIFAARNCDDIAAIEQAATTIATRRGGACALSRNPRVDARPDCTVTLANAAVVASWKSSATLLLKFPSQVARPAPKTTANPTAAVGLAVVFGAGRATWEGNFKSSVADDLPEATTAAFANVTVQSGLASTLGFLLNRSLTPRTVATIVVASSVVAMASQFVAAQIRSPPRTAYAATDVV